MSQKLRLIICTLLLSCYGWAGAQSAFEARLPERANTLEQTVDLGPGPFYGVYVIAETEWTSLTVEIATDGDRWHPVGTLERDAHTDPANTNRVVSNWLEVPPGSYAYRIRRSGGGDLRVRWYNPGHSVGNPTTVAVAETAAPACPCPLPEVQTRAAWCGAGCPAGAAPTATEVTHLIVHHSAGTNSANDWAAIVRMIYDLHVTGNGWDDIGYNYLIDPNGVVYEGRGNDIRGAHFCGKNTNTMGVCMLGTFTTVVPSDPANTALAGLLAWKACDRGLDPLGTGIQPASNENLPRIAGHRDGCATACPGDAFYPLLPQIRQATADAIAACATVGVEAVPLAARWRVFPNPARDALTLLAPASHADLGVPAFLLDLTGRTVRRWAAVRPGSPLSLAGVPAGHYRLRIGGTDTVLAVVVQ